MGSPRGRPKMSKKPNKTSRRVAVKAPVRKPVTAAAKRPRATKPPAMDERIARALEAIAALQYHGGLKLLRTTSDAGEQCQSLIVAPASLTTLQQRVEMTHWAFKATTLAGDALTHPVGRQGNGEPGTLPHHALGIDVTAMALGN
eukprot:gene41725-56494_t